jgi:citrate lyase subunit beta/citryl-CoA lyase
MNYSTVSIDIYGMIRAPRILRSVLYVPAINTKAVAKARTLDVDAVILDLEDAVAPSSKAAARELLASHVNGDWGHRSVAIRVNGLQTPWHKEDLAAIADLQFAAVVLPKIESFGEVQEAATLLKRKNPLCAVPLWAMIETPLGVLNVASIASESQATGLAGPALTCLVAGTSDLTAALGAKHVPGRHPLLSALCSIVLAARAYQLIALDGVCLQLPSAASPDVATAAYLAECLQGRSFGFHGKTLIHPTQIAGANEHFGPSLDEVAAATRIIAAYDAALNRGDGVVVVDGRLVEAMHVLEAKALLSMSQELNSRSSDRRT